MGPASRIRQQEKKRRADHYKKADRRNCITVAIIHVCASLPTDRIPAKSNQRMEFLQSAQRCATARIVSVIRGKHVSFPRTSQPFVESNRGTPQRKMSLAYGTIITTCEKPRNTRSYAAVRHIGCRISTEQSTKTGSGAANSIAARVPNSSAGMLTAPALWSRLYTSRSRTSITCCRVFPNLCLNSPSLIVCRTGRLFRDSVCVAPDSRAMNVSSSRSESSPIIKSVTTPSSATMSRVGVHSTPRDMKVGTWTTWRAKTELVPHTNVCTILE